MTDWMIYYKYSRILYTRWSSDRVQRSFQLIFLFIAVRILDVCQKKKKRKFFVNTLLETRRKLKSWLGNPEVPNENRVFQDQCYWTGYVNFILKNMIRVICTFLDRFMGAVESTAKNREGRVSLDDLPEPFDFCQIVISLSRHTFNVQRASALCVM